MEDGEGQKNQLNPVPGKLSEGLMDKVREGIDENKKRLKQGKLGTAVETVVHEPDSGDNTVPSNSTVPQPTPPSETK